MTSGGYTKAVMEDKYDYVKLSFIQLALLANIIQQNFFFSVQSKNGVQPVLQ